jgi:hypothetical protein
VYERVFPEGRDLSLIHFAVLKSQADDETIHAHARPRTRYAEGKNASLMEERRCLHATSVHSACRTIFLFFLEARKSLQELCACVCCLFFIMFLSSTLLHVQKKKKRPTPSFLFICLLSSLPPSLAEVRGWLLNLTNRKQQLEVVAAHEPARERETGDKKKKERKNETRNICENTPIQHTSAPSCGALPLLTGSGVTCVSRRRRSEQGVKASHTSVTGKRSL